MKLARYLQDGHIRFGADAERVQTTVCNGKTLMLDGKLLSLDVEALARKSLARSPETWKRFAALA